MSVTTSNIGTDERTYTYNPYRSGAWSTYLNELSRMNGQDRQVVNGELNSSTGTVIVNKSLPKEAVNDSLTEVVNAPPSSLLEIYRSMGYNPKYWEGEA